MRFLASLIFAALVTALGYYVYLDTPARPQIDQFFQNLGELSQNFQDSINQQFGYSSSGPTSQSLTVSVPKREALDWQGPGKMGNAILNKPLKVEIVTTNSTKPGSEEINTIFSVLKQYSGRAPKIDLDTTTVPEQSDYTASQVSNFIKSKRTCYSDQSNACIFMLFLPGTFENSHTLGVAFTSTSAVFMSEQFHKASNPVVSEDSIARGTITHELGHLFGLVNLVNRSPRNHEDPTHPGHSSNSNSVMYWAVEDISINAILTGGPPNTFDSNDEADIADIKAGRL